MINESLLLALALSATPQDPSVAKAENTTGRLVKFVGEQISFDSIDCIIYRWPTADISHTQGEEDQGQDDQSAESSECNGDDLHFRARYRVLESIEGEPVEAFDFFASGWTSYYAESRHALLYVLESPDGALLPPGLAVSIYPTVNGDWASCDDEIGSEALEFADDLVFGRTDGMSPHGIAQRYPPSDYVIVGNEVFCIRGRRLPALIDELDSDVDDLRDQGFPNLPKASPNETGT